MDINSSTPALPFPSPNAQGPAIQSSSLREALARLPIPQVLVVGAPASPESSVTSKLLVGDCDLAA